MPVPGFEECNNFDAAMTLMDNYARWTDGESREKYSRNYVSQNQ